MVKDTPPPAHNQLEYFIELTSKTPPVPTAVIHPVDANSLIGAVEAAERKIIEPILVGPEEKIRFAAQEQNLDIDRFRIVDTQHSHEAAETAVAMARSRDVQILMKGGLSTDEMLRAVVHKTQGVRTERRLSHIFLLDVPNYHKPLMITDAAINIVPDLNIKRDIVQNAIYFCQALGIEQPKVAILAAVEKVKSNMQSTIDAAALCKMVDRGQITGGILDGPLAFDNAISLEAARDKHIQSSVSGDADILLAPDLEAANMMGKQLIYLAGAKSAGLVMGAQVPIVLTSRAEKTLGRLASCALAALQATRGKQL
ncbi:bifunctional enoyl-CoA hydratase/phosphate acetyltransferase [Motiliproteus sp.]|uniref:bifunctional enoyl-CoA hydratase/phosphate acetyltransferase n=1 Tax=Motiliproteus sp. TaxID=1898955 RepID=UPI003BA97AD3